MKVLLYSHVFAPQVGGIETFCMDLAKGLADSCIETERIEVTVITQTTSAETDQAQTPRVIRKPSTLQLWALIGNFDKVILAGAAILPLLFALVRRKPVIVTHHGYQVICPNGLLFHLPTQHRCPGYFASRQYFQCVRCHTFQGTWTGGVKSVLLTFLRRSLSRIADVNVAVSAHVSQRIALPATKVIRNGVASASMAVTKRQDCEHALCFAYVGRLVAEKGVSTLLDAARLLRARNLRCQILIIGDGPERERLQKQAADLSLCEEVSFHGFRTGKSLQQLMETVSAVVVPSIWEDAAPLSPLEQMMRGRVIIGADIGGLGEQIADTGLRFEPGNSKALADQMQKVIENPHSIVKLGLLARERALDLYSLERMLLDYRTLLLHA